MLSHMGDSWQTENTQNHKVDGENEKCIFYFTQGITYGLFSQPNINVCACIVGGVEKSRWYKFLG